MKKGLSNFEEDFRWDRIRKFISLSQEIDFFKYFLNISNSIVMNFNFFS